MDKMDVSFLVATAVSALIYLRSNAARVIPDQPFGEDNESPKRACVIGVTVAMFLKQFDGGVNIDSVLGQMF